MSSSSVWNESAGKMGTVTTLSPYQLVSLLYKFSSFWKSFKNPFEIIFQRDSVKTKIA